MSELAVLVNGQDHKKLNSGNIPVYGSGGIMRYADTAKSYGPSVLIPRKGSLNNVFYVEGPFWNVDTIFSTKINTKMIEPKYLYHMLAKADLARMNQSSGVPSQTQTTLNRMKFDVPSIEYQRYVVRVLDKFAALVDDISIGLPAEIEARRQQYGYYRNKLLTFKELDKSV